MLAENCTVCLAPGSVSLWSLIGPKAEVQSLQSTPFSCPPLDSCLILQQLMVWQMRSLLMLCHRQAREKESVCCI